MTAAAGGGRQQQAALASGVAGSGGWPAAGGSCWQRPAGCTGRECAARPPSFFDMLVFVHAAFCPCSGIALLFSPISCVGQLFPCKDDAVDSLLLFSNAVGMERMVGGCRCSGAHSCARLPAARTKRKTPTHLPFKPAKVATLVPSAPHCSIFTSNLDFFVARALALSETLPSCQSTWIQVNTTPRPPKRDLFSPLLRPARPSVHLQPRPTR